MKEFNLEPMNRQKQEILEEAQVYLQNFEELKDCYIEGSRIMHKDFKDGYILKIDKEHRVNLIFSFWVGIYLTNLKVSDVFENIHDGERVLIKEPQPHQARKKTLEELEVGDSYYYYDCFRGVINKTIISDSNFWNEYKIDTVRELQTFKYRLKHARIFVALNKEEIKSKVL